MSLAHHCHFRRRPGVCSLMISFTAVFAVIPPASTGAAVYSGNRSRNGRPGLVATGIFMGSEICLAGREQSGRQSPGKQDQPSVNAQKQTQPESKSPDAVQNGILQRDATQISAYVIIVMLVLFAALLSVSVILRRARSVFVGALDSSEHQHAKKFSSELLLDPWEEAGRRTSEGAVRTLVRPSIPRPSTPGDKAAGKRGSDARLSNEDVERMLNDMGGDGGVSEGGKISGPLPPPRPSDEAAGGGGGSGGFIIKDADMEHAGDDGADAGDDRNETGNEIPDRDQVELDHDEQDEDDIDESGLDETKGPRS